MTNKTPTKRNETSETTPEGKERNSPLPGSGASNVTAAKDNPNPNQDQLMEQVPNGTGSTCPPMLAAQLTRNSMNGCNGAPRHATGQPRRMTVAEEGLFPQENAIRYTYPI